MDQSEAIKDLYRRSYEVYTTGDADTVARFVSRHPGVVILGTDPEERFEGAEQIMAVIPTFAPALLSAGITITPGEARAYCEGTIGWVIDTPTFTRDGRTYPCRATCIFRAEGEDWKIVHQHFSFGVPNEEAEVFKGVMGAP